MKKQVKMWLVAGGLILLLFALLAGIFFAIPYLSKASALQKYQKADINEITKNDESLAQMIRAVGIKETMAILVDHSKAGTEYDCHEQAHAIGRVGFTVEHERAFANCSAACHSGCYHGAMEGFLIQEGTQNIAENITKTCSQFDTTFGFFECFHGVGHGVMAYESYDLPEALRMCQKLPTEQQQSWCYGGVFMENVLAAEGLGASVDPDHTTTWIDKQDPHFPCNRPENNIEMQNQCYQIQTSWMLFLAHNDFAAVAKECLNASEESRSTCFSGLGRDIAGEARRNPQKILELCNVVPRQKDYYNECLYGSLIVVADFWGPALGGQASEFCSALEAPYKSECYQVLAQHLAEIFNSKNDQTRVCNTFEPKYRRYCTLFLGV